MSKKRINISIPIPNFAVRISEWAVLLYRKLKYGYTYKKIPLTKGQFAIVDAEDYNEINSFNWSATKGHTTYYARNNSILPKSKTISMHQYIMGKKPGLYIDHINHNGLDNRKANLRFATPSENAWNSRAKRIKTAYSKHKGVCWHKKDRKWTANIGYKNKRYYLGSFDSEIDAAKAYNKAAKKYHGKFAQLNQT